MTTQEKIETINRLIAEVRAEKAADPSKRCGYRPRDPGSLLNAYREGNISFDECVAAINELRKFHPDRDRSG